MNGQGSSTKGKSADDITAKLTPEQALGVVRSLFNQGGTMQAAVLREAENVLTEVEVEDVAAYVFFSLDGIDVQDCWDKSGSTRDGYTSPDDAACELVEGELRPFLDQAARYHELGMPAQETVYCMGVILGLYRYDHESKSEFKEWAEDIALNCAGDLLRQWKKRVGRDPQSLAEMNGFIAGSCPRWERDLVKDGE